MKSMTKDLIMKHEDKIRGYKSILEVPNLDQEIKDIYDKRIAENSLIIKGLKLVQNADKE